MIYQNVIDLPESCHIQLKKKLHDQLQREKCLFLPGCDIIIHATLPLPAWLSVTAGNCFRFCRINTCCCDFQLLLISQTLSKLPRPLIFPWFHFGLLHNPEFLKSDFSNEVQINTSKIYLCWCESGVDSPKLVAARRRTAHFPPLFPSPPPPSFIKKKKDIQLQ